MHHVFEIKVRADLKENVEREGVEGAHQRSSRKCSGSRGRDQEINIEKRVGLINQRNLSNDIADDEDVLDVLDDDIRNFGIQCLPLITPCFSGYGFEVVAMRLCDRRS